MSTPITATPSQGLSPAFIALFLLATGMTTLAIAGTAPILPLLQAHFSHVATAESLSRATATIGSIGIVVGAPIAVLAWLGYHEPARRVGEPAAAALRMPIRFDLIALGLCAGTVINVQAIYAPFKLNAIGVHSAAVIGLSMMPLTLLAAIISPFYGTLRKHALAPMVFALGYGGLGCGLLVFVLAPNLALALSGYALFGAALGQTLAAFYAAPLVAQLFLEFLVNGQPIRALIWLAGFSGLMCVTWLGLTVRSRLQPTTA
jgi:hypothetical protein